MIPIQFPFQLDFKSIFEWIFIGVLCAAIFYGITVIQTVFYFQTYPSDRIFLKSLVTGIWILDTLSFILVSHGAYLLVTHWHQWQDHIHDHKKFIRLRTIVAEPLCASTLALSVHLFMAYRIYVLKPDFMIVAIIIAVVSFVPWGVTLAAVILGLSTPGGFLALHQQMHTFVIVYAVFMAVLDGVIAVILVMLLRIRGHGAVKFERTDRMISTLTIYLITNNLLTSLITTTGAIAFFVSPRTLIYEAIHVISSKVYTNTFLSLLNARESIRGRGAITVQPDPECVVKNMKQSGFSYGSRSAKGFSSTDEPIQVVVHLDTITSH